MTNNKIFIIDDDEALLESLEALLIGEGYQVKAASDTQNLIAKITTYIPDVILLDYLLPNQNGEEVVELLKKQSSTKDIPIIMISASYTAKNIALNSGVNEFLAKPFDIDKLLSAIKKYIHPA